MLCYTILYYTILYYTILYYTITHYIRIDYTILQASSAARPQPALAPAPPRAAPGAMEGDGWEEAVFAGLAAEDRSRGQSSNMIC